jgi:hypothetical protein
MLQRDRKITESLSSTTAALIHFCRLLSRDQVTAGFRADTAALLNAGGDIRHLPVVLTNTFQVYPSPKMANH